MLFQPRLTFGAILFIMIQFFTRFFLLGDFVVIGMGVRYRRNPALPDQASRV